MLGSLAMPSVNLSRSSISLKITIKGGFYSETAFLYALHSFLHFPQKRLEIKKKRGNLATLSYLTELSRMLKFSKEEKQEVVTQIVPTSIIFDFPGFSVLYSPFANHFAKKRSLTK